MGFENKTLVILTPGFPVSETDTTCLPMQQSFVRGLNKYFPELNIVVLSFQYPYYNREYSWYGNMVLSFNGRNRGGPAKLLLRKKIFSCLKQIHRRYSIVGLLSFWCHECAYVGKKFAINHGLKHYCWISGQDARAENGYVRKIKPQPGELIALSDFLQDEFEKNHGIRPAYMIAPGTEADDFPRKKLWRDIDILGAGSLIALKRYDIFLEIVYELKKEMPGLKAVLCGKGPEENNLYRQREKLGLKNNVLFTGELPHEDLLWLMWRSRLLLHPSSYEGFSGVCMEALQCGAHVVSFCRAMKQDTEQWHIVNSAEAMKSTARKILTEAHPPFNSITIHTMENCVRQMMGLFEN
jgi:glycosyltransferase involved in cell wall biosynthesis